MVQLRITFCSFPGRIDNTFLKRIIYGVASCPNRSKVNTTAFFIPYHFLSIDSPHEKDLFHTPRLHHQTEEWSSSGLSDPFCVSSSRDSILRLRIAIREIYRRNNNVYRRLPTRGRVGRCRGEKGNAIFSDLSSLRFFYTWDELEYS